MTRCSNNPNKSSHRRGTVLILCVALLVILGLVASAFVILSHTERASSRALSRADQLEQVRQMSLDYVRTLLLEDIVGNDGIFLNGVAGTDADEPFDTPGEDDPWLSAHGVAAANPEIDTDGDDNDDSRWIDSVDDPRFLGFADFASGTDSDGNANIVAPDGTRYRVAIRIVDTNGLANVNVGMALDTADNIRKHWDGQFPFCLYLAGLREPGDNGVWLDEGNILGTDTVAGRIPGRSGFEALALTYELYPYLANPNPPAGVNYIRPFDSAEELALRMEIIPNTDLHGRLGALWPTTFGNNSNLLTAYSWTMQIRPPFSQTSEDELRDNLGYPGPCKIPLNGLVGSDGLTVDDNTCKAVYLALVEAGLNENEAAQFLVNLVDYIDNDDFSDAGPDISVIGPGATANSIIDFAGWLAAPAGLTGTYYGTDSQPIISEVYSYRYYDGTEVDPGPPPTYNYVLNETISRYAVELFNPSGVDIDLNGWELNIGGATHSLSGIVPAGGFRTISSHTDDHWGSIIADPKTVLGVTFTIDAGNQAIKLLRQGPGGAGNMVVVDRSEEDFGAVPTDGDTNPNPIVERYFQRPGNNDGTNWIPAIAAFQSRPAAEITLGGFPPAAMDNGGNGGQIILRNGELHSLGELFYIPKVANDGTDPKLIEAMEGQANGDSNYRLDPGNSGHRKILQYLTLRTGLNDGANNDGDEYRDNINDPDMPDDPDNPPSPTAPPESIVREARVAGLVNINTAPVEVIEALHYYYGPMGAADQLGNLGGYFASPGLFALYCRLYTKDTDWPSKDEDPDGDGVGSPDGITVDNEEKLFHFTNVANLISVRSDVFVVYITIQASDRDGDFDSPTATLRTMAIVDRSFCLRPYDDTATPAERLKEIPLPRIVAQTILP